MKNQPRRSVEHEDFFYSPSRSTFLRGHFLMGAKMFGESNSDSRLPRFGPIICLLPVLVILAGASAFAHDPGLSAAEVKLDGNKAVARLTFARNEIATMAPMDADHDGQITQPEFDAARGRLESLAKESFGLSAAGKDATPSTVTVSLDNTDAIHFDLEFSPPQGPSLTLRSFLIHKLPRGHRQFLSMRDVEGNIQAQRMLDAANDSFEFQISQTRPHAFWGFLLFGVALLLVGGYRTYKSYSSLYKKV
jgi:hypothetical protein